jgi:hypothetical protein
MDGCKIMAFLKPAKLRKAEFLTFSGFSLPLKFSSFAIPEKGVTVTCHSPDFD